MCLGYNHAGQRKKKGHMAHLRFFDWREEAGADTEEGGVVLLYACRFVAQAGFYFFCARRLPREGISRLPCARDRPGWPHVG